MKTAHYIAVVGAGIGKEKAKLPFKKVFWLNQYPVPWASGRKVPTSLPVVASSSPP